MGLVETIKALLGIGGDRREAAETGDATVTVEQERESADPADEAAVKGVDEGAVKENAAGTGTTDAAGVAADEGSGAAGSGRSTDADAAGSEPATPDIGATDEGTDAGTGTETGTETVTESSGTETAGAGDGTAGAPEETTEAETAEPGDGAAEMGAADGESEPEPDVAAGEGSDDPVDQIRGIGPAYAERLESAGIETVGELAAADAADLAERTDVPEGRASNWIERAREY